MCQRHRTNKCNEYGQLPLLNKETQQSMLIMATAGKLFTWQRYHTQIHDTFQKLKYPFIKEICRRFKYNRHILKMSSNSKIIFLQSNLNILLDPIAQFVQILVASKQIHIRNSMDDQKNKRVSLVLCHRAVHSSYFSELKGKGTIQN